ncbi:MAG: hypothetical protein IKV30_02475 [Clostridia bacterium]|nr:hypothetical protein [Clostridia bacterium]
MEDWRLCGQEKYLKGAFLYKIKLPEYWRESYSEKNDFYQKVLIRAKSQVDGLPEKEMYLEGDKIQMLWHEHCDFCWEKATTEIDAEFYCTQDYYHWICKQCFEDFKDQFGWTVVPTEKMKAMYMTNEDLLELYDRLKDDYVLVMTNSKSLDDRWTVDCPVMVGKNKYGQNVLAYIDDGMFVIEVEGPVDTHTHAFSVDEAVDKVVGLF